MDEQEEQADGEEIMAIGDFAVCCSLLSCPSVLDTDAMLYIIIFSFIRKYLFQSYAFSVQCNFSSIRSVFPFPIMPLYFLKTPFLLVATKFSVSCRYSPQKYYNYQAYTGKDQISVFFILIMSHIVTID